MPVRIVILIVVCFGQLFFAQSTWATNYEFELSKDLVTLSEEQRDNKIFQVGKLKIAASPQKVYETLTDYEHATIIFSHLRQCEVLTSSGAIKNIYFTAAVAGGLFNFDYVLEVNEHPPLTHKSTITPGLIEWRRLRGAFKDNEGYFKLEPVENGKSTLVTYSKYVDGGFLFPPFLVKKELRHDMPISLAELKDTVESENQVADNSPEAIQPTE